MKSVTGLHHVTAIAGPAQENLDFYAGVLGLRLVKKSVNQDDPDTYHLFFADAEGHPGTDLTFFPWPQMAPAREGHGLSVEVSLAVAPGSLAYWESRLERYGTRVKGKEMRFGLKALRLTDPHGLNLGLVENAEALRRDFTPWEGSPVEVARQIRGLEGVRMWASELARTTAFLGDVLGFQHVGTENGWHRYGVQGGRSGNYVDLLEKPDSQRGTWGVGGIHHLAWRVGDDDHQLQVRDRIEASGRRPTPVIDRFWFKSVYFLEPGGVLFELATDGPGFSVDEDLAHLGEALVLPPWLEAQRRTMEGRLPPLDHRMKVAK
jgi:glyoxalase family protein